MKNHIDTIYMAWMSSLKSMDNIHFKTIIITILVLYDSYIFKNINYVVSSYINNWIIRGIIMLLIVYYIPMCPLISLLLAIGYILSLIKPSIENLTSSTPAKKSAQPKKVTESYHNEDTDKNDSNMAPPTLLPIGDNEINTMNTGINAENKDIYSSIDTFTSSNNNRQIMSNEGSASVVGVGQVDNCIGGSSSFQCTGVGTFKDELNPQGMNSIQGYDGKMIGADV